MSTAAPHGRAEAAAPTQAAARPAVAIAAVILASGIIAIGNGLMLAYIPFRLDAEGFAPGWAAIIVTGQSAGGIAGCLLAGLLVRRVGHARAYMVYAAAVVLANAALGAGTDPWLWGAARLLYGFALIGIFIVAQSWLNDVVSNAIRGRVIAAFYVTYITGFGLGSLLMGVLDLTGPAAPLIGVAFAALSILPVGLTRLPQPPPPQTTAVNIAHAWRISPIGVAGMLAVGGVSMLLAAFTPIHITAAGFTQQEIALLLAAMPVGTLLLQYPFGWLSDRTDRRLVLAAVSLVVALVGMVAIRLDDAPLAVMMLVYLVWAGTGESIYALSAAHAIDRAEKDDLVALSSTLLLVWSISGFVFPGVSTVLTALYGTKAFMAIVVALAATLAAFVGWRVLRSPPAATGTSGVVPMTAQTPLPVDLAFAPNEAGDPNRDA